MIPISTIEQAHIVEFGEGRAMADLYAAAPPEFTAEQGLNVRRFGDGYAFALTAMPAIILNRAVCLGLNDPLTTPQLDEVIDHYEALGAADYGVQISPVVLSDGLRHHMEQRGLRPLANWTKFIRGVAPPQKTDTRLRVELIAADKAASFTRVFCTAYGIPESIAPLIIAAVGRPGWRYYLAFDEEIPVASGVLYVHDTIGWLGFASTLPSHRGRGAQSAIIARRIVDAASLGCRYLTTETAESTPENPVTSYHNMIRFGFQQVYLRPSYEVGSA